MTGLDLTLPTPAENLACDEALLDAAEAGEADETLRFWESPEYFVVVGYANQVAAEVNVAACSARNIPIFRRCSGGGTVLQGPGCLNYSLVLRITANGPTRSISAANEFIMEQNRAAIDSALHTPHSALHIRGHTDLVLGDRKFSGNAQRRRKNFLLFHGTFLLNFDLPLMAGVLLAPARQPDYRRGRPHREFVQNLPASAAAVKASLRQVWGVSGTQPAPPAERIRELCARRYEQPAWNFQR